MTKIRKYAVIVAAGRGTRAGGYRPKQFRDISGLPMLWWPVRAFHAEDLETKIILVLNPDDYALWREIYAGLPEEDRAIPVAVTAGGSTRVESVRNAISQIDAGAGDLVAVHDAARPMVDAGMIRRGYETAAISGTAVPVVPLTDSIRRVSGEVSETRNRSDYAAVQTPQVFGAALLKEAYTRPGISACTDDASVAENAGHRITLYSGSPRNMKVTNPDDFEIAALLVGKGNN